MGENDGSTINCYSTGSVTGSAFLMAAVWWKKAIRTINKKTISVICYSTGSVSGFSDYVGGLVGIATAVSATAIFLTQAGRMTETACR